MAKATKVDFGNLDSFPELKVIQKELEIFKAEGQTRQQKTHWFAVAGLNHANLHGDTALLTQLFESFSAKEQPEARMFKAWVAIFTTQGMTIDETEDGYKPSAPLKPRISWYDATEDKPQAEFRKTASLGKGDALPGSFTDMVEMAKQFPFWEFAAFRQLRPEQAFAPENTIRAVLRTLVTNKEKAEKAGYTLLADQLDKAIKSLGSASFNTDTNSVKIESVKPELIRKPAEIEQQPTTH